MALMRVFRLRKLLAAKEEDSRASLLLNCLRPLGNTAAEESLLTQDCFADVSSTNFIYMIRQ